MIKYSQDRNLFFGKEEYCLIEGSADYLFYAAHFFIFIILYFI